MPNIRVRFAPSPTGFLHIGGARTALFNWLFAKNLGGKFILRIEDTDEVRSTEESVNAITQSMVWLGLDWGPGPLVNDKGEALTSGTSESDSFVEEGDEGPYFQMQRQHIYKKYADQLLNEGKAYQCYCSPKDLEAMRTRAMLAKRPPKYDGRCRNLTESQRKDFENAGKKPVLRFKTPLDGVTQFEDIVRGHVSFENSLLDDFVLTKTSGIPTYHFAVVIDDYLMKITHVIRGDDHLSNTPRQILIYEGLGWGEFAKNMKWAHLSMITGSDGARLSKRHGATSVQEYEKSGYLPEVIINYLALLGWSTEDSQQIFSRDELIQKFSLEKCGKSSSAFDPQKLLWMNGEYIRKLDAKDLVTRSLPFLKKAGLIKEDAIPQDRMNLIRSCIVLEQEKIKLLTDVPHLIDFMLNEDFEFDEKSVEKVLKTPGALEIIRELGERIKNLSEFSASTIEQLCRGFAKEKGIKTGAIFHPLRVSTSGRTQGPSLFHYLEILGKEKTLKRIEKTCNVLAVH